MQSIPESLLQVMRASASATPRAVGLELARLVSLVEIQDYEMATVRARRALELMLRNAFDVSGHEPGTRPLEQVMTDLVRMGLLPAVVERHCRVVRDFGNLAAHSPASGTALDAAASAITHLEVDLSITSLVVIAGWYRDVVIPKLADRPSFRVLSSREIGLPELTQAAAIDVHVYPAEFRGKPEVLLAWHRHNPDLFTIAADVGTGRVVGCLTVLPLHEAMYGDIEKGGIIDVDLPVEGIRRYDLPDFYRLYIASVVVDPAYQGSSAFGCLYEAYLTKLLSLAQRDMFVTEILADVITPDGERLAQFIGMKQVRVTRHGSAIWKAILLPPTLRVTTRTGRQLIGYYERKYEEFKDLLKLGEAGT